VTEASDQTAANPLLAEGELIDFTAIEPAHVRPAIEAVLAEQRGRIGELERAEHPDIEWLMEVERTHERIHRVWGPVSHLNSVLSSPSLREAFNAALPLITDFSSELGQNSALYEQFVALDGSVSPAFTAVRELVRQSLRDFRLAGVALDGSAKQEFREVMLKLASKQAEFEQHIMDATDDFSHHVSESAELEGLPDMLVEQAAAAAVEQGVEGWLLRLDPPTYQTVMTHAEDEALRELYYHAWVTRASDQGPRPDQWDNSALIEEILSLRRRAAELLGFDNYAELSLATKMAETPSQVLEFLEHLAARSRDVAAAELRSLEEFAGRPLQAWDVPFFAEKLKQKSLKLAAEELRAYFPLPKVLEGLFGLAEQLFGLTITEVEGEPLWHPSARQFRIADRDGRTVGALLADFYARANKRGGAWMDVYQNRARLGAGEQNPIAHLVCNFAAPVGDKPSYLTHHDVLTLFHEFGHSLHHLLTEIDFPSIAGINGVAWDAVELPSQFLENYAWLPSVLKTISSHRKTGEPIPDETIATLGRSRSFLAGLAMVRQLEFALFDFRLHSLPEAPSAAQVQETLDAARDEVAVVPTPDFNRFQCSFSHVFAGGYAAGYYSYKWAEVLAADAFAAFEEAGEFDAATADRFRRSILAVGGSRDAMQAFVDFRGRPPELDPLLRQAGIVD
jgi:oligopeptidase A